MVNGEILAAVSALICNGRGFDGEAVARFFDDRGWLLVSNYPYPRQWRLHGVDAVYERGETRDSIAFILHESHSDWGPTDEQLAELNHVLADVTRQLVEGLGKTFEVAEVKDDPCRMTEEIDVRYFRIGSFLMQTGIFVGDGVLPTMIIARLEDV
ncbi:hypothetical protein ABIA35_005112 [Catenulispora sp. MAP12-49]|uniref:hypothetical protein n=1 Tax=unclassified Catenulispora TaxID=414885 RepID=UPI0035182FC0